MEQLILDVQTKIKEKPMESFLPLSNSFQAHRVAVSSLCTDFVGCIIEGPEGTGKTHLLKVCKQYLEDNNKRVLFLNDIENLPKIDESLDCLLIDNISEIMPQQQEMLFHWFNLFQETGGKLVMVLNKSVEDLVDLKDLSSRIKLLQRAVLSPLTDKDMEIFLLKQAFDRQLSIGQDVLNYMILRIDRDLSKAEDIINILDKESLKKHKKLTIPFVKEYL